MLFDIVTATSADDKIVVLTDALEPFEVTAAPFTTLHTDRQGLTMYVDWIQDIERWLIWTSTKRD